MNEKLKCESCRTRIPYRATEVRFSGTIIIASIRKRFERNTEGKGGREIDIRRSNSPLFRIRGNTKFHISFLVSRNNSSPRRVRRWRTKLCRINFECRPVGAKNFSNSFSILRLIRHGRCCSTAWKEKRGARFESCEPRIIDRSRFVFSQRGSRYEPSP